MNISPRTITGGLHPLNKGACDWGWQNLFAYGCHTSVVVIETKGIQIIQTLEKHRSPVVQVQWARENYHHTIDAPYTLRLASADSSGLIIIWDVCAASERASFSDGNKPVQDLQWLSTQDASHDLLVALHPPYSIVLWNADTGTKLWKKTFTDVLHCFSFDPFESSNLTLLGNDCILFVNDFSAAKPPSSNGKKFYITTPSPQTTNQMTGGMASDRRGSSASGARTALKRVRLLVGDNKAKQRSVNTSVDDPDSQGVSECLQLSYMRSRRNHLLLLYAREILILDLAIYQTVSVIPMERSGSPFQQVFPCRQRDVLMCLHDNGSISVRVRRRLVTTSPGAPTTPSDQYHGTPSGGEMILEGQDMTYDLRCQSDPLRVTKHMRTFGLACSPVSESHSALMLSDGRILFWSLMTVDHDASSMGNNHSQLVLSPLHSPGQAFPPSLNGDFEFLPPLLASKPTQIPAPKTSIADFLCPPDVVIDGDFKHGRQVLLKFVMTGLSSGIADVPVVIRMCPPLTTKNVHYYKPLITIGTSTGLVQVYNLTTGSLYREYNIHTTSVRCIEWVSLTSFLSVSYPNPSSNGMVRNELLLLDMQTGRTIPMREHKGDEPPIEALKVSHLKQYLIVLFKEKPFEIWDLRTVCLLREMPKHFPIITALEWSPSHHKKKSANVEHQSSGMSLDGVLMGSTINLAESSSENRPATTTIREHFVFAEISGVLHHFWVEGSVVHEGAKLPSESSLTTISCIAWKGETLVMADSDGNLGVWDLKAKISRNYPTHKSNIKKLKFGPGKGNLKLMFLWNDGVDIWDCREMQALSSLKGGKDDRKPVDMDWAASDKPVVLSVDGCLRVYDVHLKTSCWSIADAEFVEPVFCPYLLSPKAALAMKYTMQHQPWNKNYSLQLTSEYETPDDENIIKSVNEQLKIMPSDIRRFLPDCPHGTAQRCLLAARLFGDEAEAEFWNVALYYLRVERVKKSLGMSKEDILQDDPLTEFGIDPPYDPAANTQTSDSTKPNQVTLRELPLDMCYDVLCDNVTFRKYQLERILLHDGKRTTYEHTMKCVENFILLGQTDRAVQLLLETEPENESYLLDLMRACLCATAQESGSSQSTIKLVATSLIANGKLAEGVQLLCLINKGIDACRYLQTYNQWYQAMWLAKVRLSDSECNEVMRRWVENLCSPNVNQKSIALLGVLAMGNFTKVLQMLLSLHYYDRAAMFAEACIEFSVLPEDDDTKSLLERVFLEYARYLLALGNKKAYGHYCNRAAEKAEKVMQDMEWME
ncbi:WD repeat-containing protein 11-like [Lytechinus variegatus]|uniref:WD repeat-containing protein 11-like n=1 Tax=Lytechinus variegatus TaxID=7654 RepID=UPI001BB29974|nr:WD repeat-containing protein 11-like [Lytechinus variegatus]